MFQLHNITVKILMQMAENNVFAKKNLQKRNFINSKKKVFRQSILFKKYKKLYKKILNFCKKSSLSPTKKILTTGGG